uniref:Uncharacterized protein n=1 Tax=Mus spicilegus TaxID=10103 RepID=A0A8C6HDB7_MUSSI
MEQPSDLLQIRIKGSKSLTWWPISAFQRDLRLAEVALFPIHTPSFDKYLLSI